MVIGEFQKIFDKDEAAAVPRKQWKVVLQNGARGEELRDGFEFLCAFEGAWVMLDTMLFRLCAVAAPPRLSYFATSSQFYWLPLGKWHAILLPSASPLNE